MKQPAVVTGKRVGPSMASTGAGMSSESSKEKTKIRERQRRAITTKIFAGLRKNGSYRLSPRADINEVLRELAKEAGWIVEPDGTTYRAGASSCCPICGIPKTNGLQAPSRSIVIGGGGISGSTTGSPLRLTVADSVVTVVGSVAPIYADAGGLSEDPTSDPLAVYMYDRLRASGGGGKAAVRAYQQHQQQLYLQDSNQNTPVASPSRRT